MHIIKTHQDVIEFTNSITNLDLSHNQDTADALIYCVFELARNVVQHAKSPFGGVAIAQVFPKRGKSGAVQISVCDCGQGILSALSHNHPELQNHLESLKAAVLPHVSGAFKVVVKVRDFVEDVEQAARIREATILPSMSQGQTIAIDFEGVRFATQSFVHALLYNAFKEPGSLMKLSFVHCTRSTEEAIRAVAAYAASYRLSVYPAN